MKKSVKAVVLDAVAKAVLGTAKKACGAAPYWNCYQPKEPGALKKMMNKKQSFSTAKCREMHKFPTKVGYQKQQNLFRNDFYMKFKGLTSMVLAGVAAMSMSVPAFAASVPEQMVNQAQETVCVAMTESADNLTATERYITQNASSTNSKIDILGDENGGSVAHGATAPETLWQWSDGYYYGSCLPLYQGRGVYTNYKFKPTDRKLTVSLELYADKDWTDNRKLTVRLYKKSGDSWSYNTLKSFRFIPDPNDTNKIFEFSHTFTALDNNAEYCIWLYNDSVVHSGYGVDDYAIGADTICVSATLNASVTSAESSGNNMGDVKKTYDFIIWIYTHCGHFDTVIFALPIILLATLIYWVVRRIIHKRKFGSKYKDVRKTVRLNEMIRLLTVCWLVALFCLTLTPTEFWKTLWLYIITGENPIGILFPQLVGLPPRGFGDIVLTPTILRYALKGNLDWFLLSGWLTIPQMLLNVVLFVPFGVAAPFICAKSSFLKVSVMGLSLSFFIEFIQFFIGRECEMDDLICNTLGAIIGYLMYLLLRKLFPKFVEKCKKTARGICVEAIEKGSQAKR